MTKVLFRKDTETGEVFALFPTLPEVYEGDLTVYHLMYAHIGQHNAYADNWAKKCTKRAAPSEYAKLKAELISIGYNVQVVGYSEVVARWYNQHSPVKRSVLHGTNLFRERTAAKRRAEKRYAKIYSRGKGI
jgi:uncharacterized protein YodC (DUF2158 family)